RLEPKPADDHAIADVDGSGGCRLLADGRRLMPLACQNPLRDFVYRGARVASRRAGFAGGDEARRGGDRRRPRLQLRDHVVDIFARLTDLRVELVGEPAPGRLLAL